MGLSAALVRVSVLLLFKQGLNFGIDLRGGIQMEVAASTPEDLSRYRTPLDGLRPGGSDVAEGGQRRSSAGARRATAR